jgi:hypothetical protein
MSAEPTIKQPPFFVRFVRITVRLILILIFGGALGAGLYFGTSALYQQYTRVIEDHALRLDTLESQQTQINQLTVERLEDFQVRLEILEILGDLNKNAQDDFQSRFDALEESQATILAETDTFSESVTTLEGLVDDVSVLGDIQAALQIQVEKLSQSIKTVEEQGSHWVTLQHDNQILRAMALLTRARLHLMGNNLTLASSDIQAGRAILAALQTDVPEHQKDAVAAIVALLDESLEKLPDFPVAATDKLEGAWALLVAGLPAEAKATATPDA